MDCQDYITEPAERKKDSTFSVKKEVPSSISSAKVTQTEPSPERWSCSPSNVANELRRGTPPRKSNKGRKPGCSARREGRLQGQQEAFSGDAIGFAAAPTSLRWVTRQFEEHKWSLDACVGYARLHKLFPADEMVCTHTLYNEVWAGNLDLSVTELPEAMKRKRHKF